MLEKMENYLLRMGIKVLNEMQEDVIRRFQEEGDTIVYSNTGSGKTLAFLLSILSQVKTEYANPQAMIVVPSRELALQIDDVFRKMGTQLKITLCYGGHKREIEELNLVEAPVLIIGTAGRICDHIRRKNFDVSHIQTLVLDEFDKSLELGFEEEMKFILESVAHVKKKMLTSATQFENIPAYFDLQNPKILNHVKVGEEASNFDLEIKKLISPEKDKVDTLFNFLCFANHKPCIVFCNHRDAVERVASLISSKGIKVSYYHGGMEQRERESELFMFRNGTSNVLITTDLAARGLDIPGIRYIIHYHLPVNEESFTHRNGRTARMHDFGTAIFLLNDEEAVPNYVSEDIETIDLDEHYEIPARTQWTTLHISLGKKDKVNKVDIVGFLSQRGELKKDDIGLIEVKDYYSFVAVRRTKAGETLRLIGDSKLKNKKVKIGVASSMAKGN
jgi:superfamily II DNA/RNA helicase